MAKKRASDNSAVVASDSSLEEMVGDLGDESKDVKNEMIVSEGTQDITETPPLSDEEIDQNYSRIFNRANRHEISRLHREDDLDDVEQARLVERASAEGLSVAHELARNAVSMFGPSDAIKAIKDVGAVNKNYLEVRSQRIKAQLDNFDSVRGQLIDRTIAVVVECIKAALDELDLDDELQENILNTIQANLEGSRVDLEEG